MILPSSLIIGQCSLIFKPTTQKVSSTERKFAMIFVKRW